MNSTIKQIVIVLVTGLAVGFGTYLVTNNQNKSDKTMITPPTAVTAQALSKDGEEDLAFLEKNDGFNLKEINEYILVDIKSVFPDAKLISASESPDHSIIDPNYPIYGQRAVLVYSVSKTITDVDFSKISLAIVTQKTKDTTDILRYKVDNLSNKGSLMFREAGGSNIRLIMIPDLNDTGVHNFSVFVY